MATANGQGNGQLTAKQQKALWCLMSEPTIISAAAKIVLDLAIHAVEIDVLESRIAALESAMGVLDGSYGGIDYRSN